MAKRDSRIDEYISRKPEFAQKVMHRFRKLVHKTSPEIEEDIKWSSPTFMYNDPILCGIAVFKKHCTISFWRGADIKEKHKFINTDGRNQMGLIKEIKSVDDLPDDKILISYFKEAMILN